MPSHGHHIERILRNHLYPRGFDLVHAFRPEWYNAHLWTHLQRSAPADCKERWKMMRLPEYKGEGDAQYVGFLVGNSRHLWPKFVASPEGQAPASGRGAANPLDSYSERCINEAMSKVLDTIHGDGLLMVEQPFFSHEMADSAAGIPRVAFQHLAHACGLCYLVPGVSLCIHKEFGPWIAFRACIVLQIPVTDADTGLPMEPTTIDDPMSAEDTNRMITRFNEALSKENFHWSDLCQVREACSLGQEHKYGPSQFRYHYTRDRKYIRHEVDESTGEKALEGAQ